MSDDTTIEIDPEQLRATIREVVREELARIDAEWPDPDAEAGAGVPAKGRVRVSGGGTTGSPPGRPVDSLDEALEQARDAGVAERVPADAWDRDSPVTDTDGGGAPPEQGRVRVRGSEGSNDLDLTELYEDLHTAFRSGLVPPVKDTDRDQDTADADE